MSRAGARREDYWRSMGQSAQSGGPSRLPKHKCADREDGQHSPSTRRIEYVRSSRTTRLATKPGIKLREEAIAESGDGARRSRSWAAVTREWRDWLAEAKQSAAVFEGTDPETGERREVTAPLENRFMQTRQRRLYGKLKDVERGARRAYGKRLSTVMLTFTASARSGAGDWSRCPANHLDDLLGSWSAIRRALKRALGGRRFEYARMLEPHKSGYAHVHLAVFVEGPIRAEQFEPVMRAHTRNCLPAGWEAHRPEGDAVSVREGVENIGAYLSSYLMEWDEEAAGAPENVQRFNALLWATGRRRWSLSSGAQEWAAWSPPDREGAPIDWEMTHIEIREECYPIDEGGGGVLRLALDDSAAGRDPPPVR